MNSEYAELTVLVPVSQYVKVEAVASEDSRSLKSTASFLLSKWVLATQGRNARGLAGHSSAVNAGGRTLSAARREVRA